MFTIAIDSGGDYGFPVVLKGAKKEVQKNKDVEIVIVAGKDKLLHSYSIPERVYLEQSDCTYSYDNKKNIRRTSIYRAIEMHKSGDVDAVIAPGDTTATVISASKILKRIKRLHPYIPTHWPYNNTLIDVGAKQKCDTKDFLQLAILGKFYSENYIGARNPLIGILGMGEEAHKGDGLKLIEKLKDEGYRIAQRYFEGNSLADFEGNWVALTEGKTGNSILKLSEELFRKGWKDFRNRIDKQTFLLRIFAYIGNYKPFREMKEEFDWRNYAVSPLLCIKGNILIAHGRSDEKAISSAIRKTKEYLKKDLVSKLEEELDTNKKI